jgi:hypothetical protein
MEQPVADRRALYTLDGGGELPAPFGEPQADEFLRLHARTEIDSVSRKT